MGTGAACYKVSLPLVNHVYSGSDISDYQMTYNLKCLLLRLKCPHPSDLGLENLSASTGFSGKAVQTF